MIEQLLAEIRGGVRDTTTLAARLGVSPELVEAMLDHLARIGRLQAADLCGEGCEANCPLGTLCHPSTVNHSGGRIWSLTEKN